MSVFRASLPAWVGGLFASHFLGFGLYLPFFPLVLEARGLSVDEIGFVLGAGTIARIAANPVLTNLSDRIGKRRQSIFLYSVLASLFLALFALTEGAASAWITVAGLMVFWTSIIPLSDAYALDVARNTGADYARMRLWGSVAFVIANLVGGWLVVSGSTGPLMAVLFLCVLSTGFVALLLPPQDRSDDSPAEETARPTTVFRSRWFLAVIFIGGLLQATHAAYYGFGTLYWIRTGIDEISIGGLWAIGVVAEIGLFYVAKQLIVMGPMHFMLLAAGGSVLRWVLFPYAESLPEIAALQLLHGISFGAAHLGSVSYLSKVVPPKWAATGQGLLGTSSGILLAAGLAVCGPLFDLDPAYPFFAMAAAAAVAFVALLVLWSPLARRLEEA